MKRMLGQNDHVVDVGIVRNIHYTDRSTYDDD
jgi:hypothetical protein